MPDKSWNKEPIPCYHCMMPACSEIGERRDWYCFSCIMNLFGDEEEEVDDTLQVCPQQLEIQSRNYS